MQELSKQSLKRVSISPTDSASLFNRTSYINELVFYPLLFQKIPIVIEEKDIDCKRASKWFAKAYEETIKDSYYVTIRSSPYCFA